MNTPAASTTPGPTTAPPNAHGYGASATGTTPIPVPDSTSLLSAGLLTTTGPTTTESGTLGSVTLGSGAPESTIRASDSHGGHAEFRYTADTVDLVVILPTPGFAFEAYRVDHDHVVVRFISPQQVSTIHAYWSPENRPTVAVRETEF